MTVEDGKEAETGECEATLALRGRGGKGVGPADLDGGTTRGEGLSPGRSRMGLGGGEGVKGGC